MHNVWFAATVLGVATFASAQVVSLRQGTAIRVRLDQTLSSSTSKSGDTVRFEALDNVIADGKIAVARSAVVGGEIIDTKGSDGHIRFVVRYVVAAEGSRLDVNSSRHAKGSKGARNIGIGMAIVGHLNSDRLSCSPTVRTQASSGDSVHGLHEQGVFRRC